jgi:hypothetical protein
MKTVSQKPVKNATKKSSSKAVAAKTPIAKQAKRYKQSSDNWRNKKIAVTLENNSNKKRISELKESRACHKEKNINLEFELEQLEKKYNREVSIRNEEKQKRILAELEVLNAHDKLQQLIKQLDEAHKQIDFLSNLQIEFEKEIENIDKKIDDYNFEKLKHPKSNSTVELSEGILAKLNELEKQINGSERHLEDHYEENMDQINKKKLYLEAYQILTKSLLIILNRNLKKSKRFRKI